MDDKGDRRACLGELHTSCSKKVFLPFFSLTQVGKLMEDHDEKRKTWRLHSISRFDPGSSSVSDFTSFLDGMPTCQPESQHWLTGTESHERRVPISSTDTSEGRARGPLWYLPVSLQPTLPLASAAFFIRNFSFTLPTPSSFLLHTTLTSSLFLIAHILSSRQQLQQPFQIVSHLYHNEANFYTNKPKKPNWYLTLHKPTVASSPVKCSSLCIHCPHQWYSISSII